MNIIRVSCTLAGFALISVGFSAGAEPPAGADAASGARAAETGVDLIPRQALLIAQGANDPRVRQAESDQIVAAMGARDIPVTYVLYPDEGHGFAVPENRLSFYAVAEGFLAHCLGGRYEPVGDDFRGASIQVPAGADFVPGLAAALGDAAEDGDR